MNVRIAFAWLYALLLGVPAVPASQSESERLNTDPELEEIETLFRPAPRGGRDHRTNGGASQGGAASELRAAANKAKAVRLRYPQGHSRAAQARRLEAKALLNAALMGDSGVTEEAVAIAEEARKDTTLPVGERFELAKLRELVRSREFIHDARQLRYQRERSAKRLIEEFPNEAGGYEALLREAENQPEGEKAASLANEILASAAPPHVKEAAQTLAERYALIGQSFREIASEALGADSPIVAAGGGPTIIYAWATWSPGAIAFAKQLSQTAPAGAVLVGVCLDVDVEAARSAAAATGLPGQLVFDAQGVEGVLARRLKLTAGMPVYLTDRHGSIKDVAAERGDIVAKLDSVIR